MPIATLRSAPFNLPWGASIKAKIYAINDYGTSDASPVGNGAIILTIPDPPENLVHVASETTSEQISLVWTDAVEDGGTEIISYTVNWDQGTGTYAIFA